MDSIDLRQVLILARYALTSEWRLASTRSMNRRRKMSRGWAYGTVITYLFVGALSIRIFLSNTAGEPFITAAAIFMLYGAFIIGSNIFMSFGSGFLSPDEARIISMLPVSSDTFFLSRLVVLICYTTAISLLLSIGPLIALQFFLKEGAWWILLLQNILFEFAFILSGITASMAIIVVYGLVIGKLPSHLAAKITGYVQFIGSFVTAISFVVLSQVQHRIDLHTVTSDSVHWIIAIPAYWFGSLASLANGVSSFHILLAIVAIAFFLLLSVASHLLLGKKYQMEVEELGASSAAITKEHKSKPDSWIYRLYIRFARSDEARSIFQVLRAQFRYDAKFRMQFLAALPPTFLYLLIAVLQGGIVDPFNRSLIHSAGSNMFYLVAMLMPLISIQAIAQSDNYKAAWIFFTSPVDRAKLLLAVRNMLVVSIVIPYMIVVTIIFSYYMPLYHAIENTLVVAGLAGLMFQLYLIINPKMPFSQQRRPNRVGFVMMAGITLLAVIPLALFALAIIYGYKSQERYWPMLAIIVTISAVLETAVRARIRRKLDREEFEV